MLLSTKHSTSGPVHVLLGPPLQADLHYENKFARKSHSRGCERARLCVRSFKTSLRVPRPQFEGVCAWASELKAFEGKKKKIKKKLQFRIHEADAQAFLCCSRVARLLLSPLTQWAQLFCCLPEKHCEERRQRRRLFGEKSVKVFSQSVS